VGLRLLMAAVLLVASLPGCYDTDPDWRLFRVEFSNQTTDEFIFYDISGYVYASIDKDDPRVKENRDGNRPRGVMIINSQNPGGHDFEETGFTDWSMYSFEAHLSSAHGEEFKEFPVDAEGTCPNVEPVALKVTARDGPLGGVVYSYDFNCR
jgi:hypothetical protein